MALMLPFSGLVSPAQVGARPVPADEAAPTQTASPAKCLEGDPLGLAELDRVLRSDSPGDARVPIGRHIVVDYLGQGTLVDEEPVMPQGELPELRPPDEPRELPRAVDDHYTVFVPKTRAEYKVSVKAAALQQLRDCYMQTGRHLPDPPPDSRGSAGETPAAAGLLRPLGWSNADDTRVIWDPNPYPRRTIAAFSKTDARCSGTLVGPRVVITAAHCVVKEGTSTYYAVRLTPARDGEGDTTDQVVVQDTGLNDDVAFWTPWGWRDPAETSRRRHDIAMIVMANTQRLGDKYSFMGVFARSVDGLETQPSWNRGYPNCKPIGEERGNLPAGCTPMKMYGDTKNCDGGYFSQKDSTGMNRLYWTRCDASAGHSGSALYQYIVVNGKEIPSVVGVMVAEKCFKCSSGEGFPNQVRRVTTQGTDQYLLIREHSD